MNRRHDKDIMSFEQGGQTVGGKITLDSSDSEDNEHAENEDINNSNNNKSEKIAIGGWGASTTSPTVTKRPVISFSDLQKNEIKKQEEEKQIQASQPEPRIKYEEIQTRPVIPQKRFKNQFYDDEDTEYIPKHNSMNDFRPRRSKSSATVSSSFYDYGDDKKDDFRIGSNYNQNNDHWQNKQQQQPGFNNEPRQQSQHQFGFSSEPRQQPQPASGNYELRQSHSNQFNPHKYEHRQQPQPSDANNERRHTEQYQQRSFFGTAPREQPDPSNRSTNPNSNKSNFNDRNNSNSRKNGNFQRFSSYNNDFFHNQRQQPTPESNSFGQEKPSVPVTQWMPPGHQASNNQ